LLDTRINDRVSGFRVQGWSNSTSGG